MMKRFYAINDHSKYFSSLSIKYLLFTLIYSYIFSYSQSTNLAYFLTTCARSTEYWIMFTLTTRGRLSASIVSADTRSIVSTVTRSTVGQHIGRHSVSLNTRPTLYRTIDTWPILDRYLTDTLPMLWYFFLLNFNVKLRRMISKLSYYSPLRAMGIKQIEWYHVGESNDSSSKSNKSVSLNFRMCRRRNTTREKRTCLWCISLILYEIWHCRSILSRYCRPTLGRQYISRQYISRHSAAGGKVNMIRKTYKIFHISSIHLFVLQVLSQSQGFFGYSETLMAGFKVTNVRWPTSTKHKRDSGKHNWVWNTQLNYSLHNSNNGKHKQEKKREN